MFSKLSRYYKLLNVTTSDATGRTRETKSLRLLPEVTGTFLHTIEEIDRLDHLAHKYYKQSQKWWRICDANPDTLSPLVLLGKAPQVVAQFPIDWSGPVPLWSDLLKALSNAVGVEEARLGTPDQPNPAKQITMADLLFAVKAGLVTDLDDGVLTQRLSLPLRQALEDENLSLGAEVRVVRIAEHRWQVTDQTSKQVYSFRLEAGTLNVYENLIRYAWTVTISYNKMTVSVQEISDLISTVGFGVLTPETVGRVGKQIIIPPDRPG